MEDLSVGVTAWEREAKSQAELRGRTVPAVKGTLGAPRRLLGVGDRVVNASWKKQM